MWAAASEMKGWERLPSDRAARAAGRASTANLHLVGRGGSAQGPGKLGRPGGRQVLPRGALAPRRGPGIPQTKGPSPLPGWELQGRTSSPSPLPEAPPPEPPRSARRCALQALCRAPPTHALRRQERKGHLPRARSRPRPRPATRRRARSRPRAPLPPQARARAEGGAARKGAGPARARRGPGPGYLVSERRRQPRGRERRGDKAASGAPRGWARAPRRLSRGRAVRNPRRPAATAAAAACNRSAASGAASLRAPLPRPATPGRRRRASGSPSATRFDAVRVQNDAGK